MQINVHTSHKFNHAENMHFYIKETMLDTLKDYKDIVTNVDVILSLDSEHHKMIEKCVVEAHVQGTSPLVISSKGENLHFVVNESSKKIKKVIKRHSEKLKSHRIH